MAKKMSESLSQLLLSRIEEELKGNPEILSKIVTEYLTEYVDIQSLIHDELFDKVEQFAIEALEANQKILKEAISEEIKLMLTERGDYIREILWEEDVQTALGEFLAKKIKET